MTMITTIAMMALLQTPMGAMTPPQQPKARCDVYVIGASAKKAPLPKSLKQFSTLFSRMPFKMYKGFQLKHLWHADLVFQGSREYAITKADSVKLTLKNVSMNKGKNARKWYKLRFELYRKQGRAKRRTYDMLLRLLGNKPMFVAGPEEQGETLFIGVVCK